MRCRPDIHATVHLHPDDVIAFSPSCNGGR
ncbi:hypothetical protein M5G17_16100 [Pseudomonas sp. TNT2022 ID1025]|uniref:Uncharacterized protein n=1 Tax=Pseudomonas rubra TaxID=2942627 RepID=A0ABT5PA66_9PSED|nr:hypothetical protein [Pseudomonas rubra]MDD1015192.1 hypothetical protein [Pseudomonas rubra]MDD1037846.1 hypothetical protein [Pseudomonas rubra]